MRALSTAVAVLALAASASCAETLPTGPSVFTTGVVIYEDANFKGESAHITSDIPDLEKYSGGCITSSSYSSVTGTSIESSWADCMSSIKVARGWRAKLYPHSNYNGTPLEVTMDIPDLNEVAGICDGKANDCVSSIRVERY